MTSINKKKIALMEKYIQEKLRNQAMKIGVTLKSPETVFLSEDTIFGKNVVITEIDIAHYFSKPFNLDGPKPMSDFVEFDLPNGEKRQISVKADSSTMEIIDDAIIVKTLLNFQKK